jgi:hypothetical protein
VFKIREWWIASRIVILILIYCHHKPTHLTSKNAGKWYSSWFCLLFNYLMMKWRRCRKISDVVISGTVAAFAWRDWEKLQDIRKA